MIKGVLKFIHKDGRVIPIRAAAGRSASQSRAKKTGKAFAKGAAGGALAAGAVKAARGTKFGLRAAKFAAGAAGTVALKDHKSKIKVNKMANAAALGTAVASGVIGAATFASGTKGFLLGSLVTHGIDAAGIAANVASVAGKGHAKERAKQGAKQEARNLLIGNAIYAAGIVAVPRNRQAAVAGAKIVGGYAAKVLNLGRKALRVIP